MSHSLKLPRGRFCSVIDIMHWRWGGYYDCVDIEHFTDRQVPAGQIDGVEAPGNDWGKVDHCQYVDPLRVLSRCMPANDGAQKCLDAVNTGWHNSTSNGGAVQPRYLNRIGINVVPLVNPASTAFPDRASNIPWRNETCSNSRMTRLTGTVTYNPLPAPLSDRVGDPVPGHGCAGVVFREIATIREAVQRCSVVWNCNFLQWEPSSNTSTAAAMWAGVHQFRGCSRSTPRGYVDQRLFARPARFSSNYDVTPAGVDQVFQVSFQPATATGVVLEAGWHADTGGVFQRHGSGASSLQYGWTCAVPTCQPQRRGFGVAEGAHCMAYNPGATASNATAATTRVTSLHNGYCGVGAARTRNAWEIALPNGVYQTEMYMGMPETRMQNCIIQGTQFSSNEIVRGPLSTKKVAEVSNGRLTYGTFRLNFHRFDRFELDLRGHMHVRGAVVSCLRLSLADIVLI